VEQIPLLTLAVIGPLIFGVGIALLAFWLFDLAAVHLPVPEVVKTVAQVLGWFFGQGAIVLGGTHLVNLSEALQGVRGGTAFVLLSYLGGFGLGLILRFGVRDRSLIGTLQRYLNGRQTEAVLLMLRYETIDIETAAAKMRVTPDEFVRLYEEALRIIHRRWRTLKDLLPEVKNGPP
jgi:hypothetical protein